jgi:hypothetical protein
MDWEVAGRMLVEMHKAGWETTLAGWAEKKGRWICDTQKGNRMQDPDLFAEAEDPLDAIESVYAQWKEFMRGKEKSGSASTNVPDVAGRSGEGMATEPNV